jgi:hypothetical protein
MSDLFPTIERDASISDCGKYRWSLTRSWNFNGKWLGWIMLNPSTADANIDDPTIRKCMGFAHRLGFGAITVCNLFPYRATDPSELLKVDDPRGLKKKGSLTNHDLLLDLHEVCPVVILAWGALDHQPFIEYADKVIADLRRVGSPIHCLGKTKGGHPRHPLYLPYDTPLIRFDGGAA